MRIAVQGCGHGQLHAVYAAAAQRRAELLLVCGDYQAMRDERDLADMACPAKYRRMGDFVAYYSGAALAPMPSVFIGGNHEASGHLWELYHGGYAAPGIFYAGHAGAYVVGGLTIAGISGTCLDSAEAQCGYGQRRDTTDGLRRSVNGMRVPAHYTRAFEAARLHTYAAVLRSGAFGDRRVDVFMSHEWPRGAAAAGDLSSLLRCKPFFAPEVAPGGRGLGTAGLQRLLDDVRPAMWFAAHLHVRHEARFGHPDGSATAFLALDKCLPGRTHMEALEAGGVVGPVCYDPAWLAVVRAYDPFMNAGFGETRIPDADELRLDEHVSFVRRLASERSLEIPQPDGPYTRLTARRQTAAFCAMLGLRNHWGQ